MPITKKTLSIPSLERILVFPLLTLCFQLFDLDLGTDILIRAIVPSSPKSILDIGCGYGPLGIMLATVNPKALVTLVDRDLLAVRYARINIQNSSRNTLT